MANKHFFNSFYFFIIIILRILQIRRPFLFIYVINKHTTISILFPGHFSQVVWAGTQEMGIGTARFEKDDRYWTVMVGFYYPPGNMNKPQEFPA